MKKAWKPLKPGDIVDVIAPGFKTDQIPRAKKFLESWGLVPRIPEDLMGDHFLHSNSDSVRFKHLKNALLAKDSSAIWCLRGGYGSNRLLPMLSKLKKPSHQKWFIGISDVTSLHVYLNQNWGWPTLHGPLLGGVSQGKLPLSIINQIHGILFDLEGKELLYDLKSYGSISKNVKGEIMGGNLTVLQSMIGTPFEPNTQGKILVIEDLGERSYRIDRMLEHMRQAGLLKGLRALVFGEFLGTVDPDGRDLFNKIIQRWSKDLPIPVYYGLKVGHSENQRPIPLGVLAEIKKGTLKCSIHKKP